MSTSEKKHTLEDEEMQRVSKQLEVDEEHNEESVSSTPSRDPGAVSVIAGHYNSLEQQGLEARSKSRIFYMRNFNNWIKSVLISSYLTKVQDKKMHGQPVKVLDIGCGKGGDLMKWKAGRISHLLCADVADVSVEHCKQRYNDLKSKSDGRRGSSSMFSAEFIHADCTKEKLRKKYQDPSIKLDLVSCQFAFHYCFESLQQADTMLCNVAECLAVGGFFIGTIPDANEIVKRQIKAGHKGFGNSVYNITFECSTEPSSSLPLFGAKYNFHLEGVVSCPEFLVHFPTFVRLAEKHGLKLICKETFGQIFKKHCKSSGFLLQKMQALETYSSAQTKDLLGDPDTEYNHGKSYLDDQGKPDDKLGTISKDEWEAISIYLAFAFEKVKDV